LRIHYQTWGEGRPIVLVCGWSLDNRTNWIAPGWIEALSGERRVIALEPRGHGLSDKPHEAEAYSYVTMSRDVLALLDHLEIAEADYFGYSMGAFMGAWLLGHHPERFGAMVLGGIGDESEETVRDCVWIAEALRAEDASKIADPMARMTRQFVAANPNNDLEALAVAALRMWPEGYPLALGGERLANAGVRVLIVNGENDHPYVDSADALAAAIPGARHVRIAGANHLTAVAAPGFKAVVVEFLAGR
jgi:pimeloyl-ACP methyl ester carboxylesterase